MQAKHPGLLPWSQCPDGVILQYFKFAEAARLSREGGYPAPAPQFPENSTTVDQLYAEADEKDLSRLYQVRDSNYPFIMPPYLTNENCINRPQGFCLPMVKKWAVKCPTFLHVG